MGKSYGEGCVEAHALDLIGDRWALLVVRELMLGPKRFGAIRQRLPGIATNMLTRRLEELEEAGILARRPLAQPAGGQGYGLTDQGLALWPILRELCRWGASAPGHDHRLPISPTALMLSMRAMWAGHGTAAVTATFALEDEEFVMIAGPDNLTVTRGDLQATTLRFTGTANDMAVVVYGPQTLAQSVEGGLLEFSGDRQVGQTFLDAFSLGRTTA